MTTAANGVMAGIHDRTPVILDRANVEEWIDPEVQEHDAIAKMLKPCPDSWLSTVEISSLVNSPKNNSPAVLESVSKT